MAYLLSSKVETGPESRIPNEFLVGWRTGHLPDSDRLGRYDRSICRSHYKHARIHLHSTRSLALPAILYLQVIYKAYFVRTLYALVRTQPCVSEGCRRQKNLFFHALDEAPDLKHLRSVRLFAKLRLSMRHRPCKVNSLRPMISTMISSNHNTSKLYKVTGAPASWRCQKYPYTTLIPVYIKLRAAEGIPAPNTAAYNASTSTKSSRPTFR